MQLNIVQFQITGQHNALENLFINSITNKKTKFLIIKSFFFADPPGAPYIEGYTQGETLRRGQTVELMCRSRGGNPPAQLIWYKNGSQIRMAYR